MVENDYENVLESENRFKYNGKELQDDLGLNWYDYGARMYDAAIGRFNTQDAFAEKYLDFSPYQYAANNPIIFIDINGDSLALTGEQDAIQNTLNIVNKASAGFYKATVGENGLVSYTSTGKEGEMTDEQKAFINNFSAVVNSEDGTVNMSVVKDSEDVLIGSFYNESIDVGDISKFGDGPSLTEQGALIHEVTEQAGKQLYNMPHGYASDDKPSIFKAHDIGNNSENAVNGTVKTRQRQQYVQDPNNPKAQSGRIIISVTKGNQSQDVHITIERNNVLNVYQR